jgi:hypothetical protein
MSLRSRKAGSHFGTITKSGPLPPQQVANLIVKAAKQLGINPTVQMVSIGVGTVYAESAGDPKNPGDGTHIGLWMEEPGFGSNATRLDAYKSTIAALERWKADGGSFNDGWTKWEHGETEGTGADRAPHYVDVARRAIMSGGAGSHGGGSGEEKNIFEEVAEPFEEAFNSTVGAGLSAEEFLVEVAETLLDFRKLGQLAVEAFSWFLRLLLHAIWDYVIAPVFHWAERAEIFYWRNFFGVGTEQGSGFGYQLRQNAAIITIGFWAIGYAVLWSDGESLSPVEPHESMVGRAVKGVEGKIARRNLVKPKDVKEETPDKPKPKTSTVKVERIKEYAVSRKRPVSVSGPGSEKSTGKVNDGNSRGLPVRPEKKDEAPQIILPPGAEREQPKIQNQTKVKAKAPA